MSLISDLKTGLETILDMAVYPINIPAGATRPAASYRIISTVRPGSHDGDSGLPTARVQVDIEEERALIVETAGDALVDALRPGRVTLGMLDARVRVENDFTDYDPELRRYRRTMDLMLTYKEV